MYRHGYIGKPYPFFKGFPLILLVLSNSTCVQSYSQNNILFLLVCMFRGSMAVDLRQCLRLNPCRGSIAIDPRTYFPSWIVRNGLEMSEIHSKQYIICISLISQPILMMPEAEPLPRIDCC